MEHIHENDVFRCRLKYTSIDIEDSGKLTPEPLPPLQVPFVATRQKEPQMSRNTCSSENIRSMFSSRSSILCNIKSTLIQKRTSTAVKTETE